MVMAGGFGVTLLLTKYRHRLEEFDPRYIALLVALYGFIGLTIVWSGSKVTALPRYTGFVLVSLWTVYAAIRVPQKQLLKILIITLLCIGFVSAVVVTVAPDLGTEWVDRHKGNWKGIFAQKNGFGKAMALLVVVSMFYAVFYKDKAFGWSSAAIGLFMVLSSGSRTALIVVAIMIVSIGLLTLRRYPWVIVTIFLCSVGGGLAIALRFAVQQVPLLGIQGGALLVYQSQISLTGRLGLWQFCVLKIFEKPWFGYGYDGFWKIDIPGREAIAVWWPFQQAHNGYIDLVLQLGFLGGLVYLVVVIIFARRGFKNSKFLNASEATILASLLLSIFLLANLTMSYFLLSTSIFSLFSTYSMVQLCKRDLLKVEAEEEDVEEHEQEDTSRYRLFRSKARATTRGGMRIQTPTRSRHLRPKQIGNKSH